RCAPRARRKLGACSRASRCATRSTGTAWSAHAPCCRQHGARRTGSPHDEDGQARPPVLRGPSGTITLMTESEGLAATSPQELLASLRCGWASQRKLRLFGAACCRRIWELLDRDSRKAVEVAERFADGRATEEELRRACDATRNGRRADPIT